jgi:ACS family pantothenate transporter-like MFS transporter
MFVFDASVTALLAYFGHRYLPDYPHNTKWLNKQERELAVKRLESAIPTGTNTMAFTSLKKWGKVKSLLTNKYLLPFTFGWAGLHIAMGATHVLGIVSKKLGYDAVTANLLTTVSFNCIFNMVCCLHLFFLKKKPDTILTMIAGLINGFLSDKYRTRLW